MTTVRVAEILSAVVGGATHESDIPLRLVTAAARALPVTGVGLVLMTDAGPAGTVAVSDRPAATMEELQFTLGEGPCVECSTTGRPVLQPDLAATGLSRWPAFAAGALDAGILAIFALPLRMGGIRLGVLDLYRDRAGELSAAELAEALSFADAATALLLHLQAEASADRSGIRGIRGIEVIEDRAEVHQATGVISVQLDVSMAEALLRLRARAYASESPILKVALDVLGGALRFDEMYDDDDDGNKIDGR